MQQAAKMNSFLSYLIFLFIAVAHALNPSGKNRLLVLLDDVAEKDGYSTFLADLEGRGYQISYETPKSESLQLFHLGELAYDHIFLLPSRSKGLGPNLTPELLLKFINANGNILLTTSASTAVPSSIVNLLSELDISLPADRIGLVVDHFNHDVNSAAEQHDVLALPPPSPVRSDLAKLFLPETPTNELLAFPSGIGHALGSSPMLAPILRAPKTAYSINPKEPADVVDVDELFAAGEQLALVSGFQARNSARLTIVGSAEMLSNKWFDAKVKKSGGSKVSTWNREFAKRVSGWTFHELGVLRVNSVDHALVKLDGTVLETNQKIYRINNNVTYSISMSQYEWNQWVPFQVPEGDHIQMEFNMLNPYFRLNLTLADTTTDSSVYSVAFGLPDQHGIYNFLVNYKRPLLTNVEEKNTVTVRHIAHDEWTRSYAISGAWPWLLGIWTTVIGFLAFSALWMYSAPVSAPTTKKTQ